MGYLLCKKCKGRYDIQPGELPDDPQNLRCHCGGELEFYDSDGQKRNYRPVNKGREDMYRSSGADMVRLLFVGGLLIVGIFLALIFLMFLSMSITAGGAIFAIIVLIIIFAVSYSLFRVLLRTISRL